MLSYLAEGIPNLSRTIAINTDADSLHRCNAGRKILVGDIQDEPTSTNAARRLVVRRTARSAISEISEAVASLDMVLLVAGMGGVAGTEISPIVAQVMHEQNIFTLGFPILPFDFEGQRRNEIARQGAAELGRHVHSLYPIFNESFAQAAGENVTMDDIFSQASLSILQHCKRVTGAVAAGRLAGIDLFVYRTCGKEVSTPQMLTTTVMQTSDRFAESERCERRKT